LERFTVRPGITATVQYGADHPAFQIKLEPYKSIIGQDPLTAPLSSSQEVSEVLEELVPRATRGKEIGNASFQCGCAMENVNDFENVLILRGASAPRSCERSAGLRRANYSQTRYLSKGNRHAGYRTSA
jgi:hypothetical protein